MIALVGFLLIRFAAQLLMKILGFLILIGLTVYLLFHFGIGPFEKNPVSIFTLEEKYCSDPEEKTKCICIVQPIKRDMLKRFSMGELTAIRQHRTTMAYLVKKSYAEVKPEIVACLKSRGAEQELKEFGRDMIPVENEVLEEIEKKTDKMTEKSRNVLDSMVSRKDRIDERYK